MAVGYASNYSTAWYSGAAHADAALVPGTYVAAVNGRPYMLNTDPQAIDSYGDFFKEESLPLLRQQADSGKYAAEQSISPTQFWRRAQESWHKGAGQSVLDRDASDPARFHASKGIDPWTRHTLTMLKATTAFRTSANTNLFAAAVTDGYVLADGQALLSGTTFGAPATVTGTPASAVTGLASNGGVVYAGFGTNGIYSISGTTATSYVTGSVNKVGYAKGRLLAAYNNALHNPIAAGALPAPFFTHPSTGWSWSAFAEGDSCIYLAGDVGNTSQIYRTAVVADTGTGLAPPQVAATLPTNEIVRAMLGYLGYVVIGTDKGVRFATATSSGDLTLGALIPTTGAVEALEALGHYVWFAWTNYDATSSGLGRLDLTAINDNLAPAYASDLMATAQGAVKAIWSVNGRHGFSVAGAGFYAESATDYVPTATLTSGQITYGIADPKVAVKVDLKHLPLPASTSVAVSASYDRAAATTLGSSAAAGSVSPPTTLSAGRRRNEEIELTFTLTAGTAAPTLTRWTLLSYPAPAGASLFTLPLVLAPRITTLRDTEQSQNPFTEYQFLVGLHQDREICTVQLGADSFEGTVEDYTWIPNVLTWNRDWWAGTFVAKIRKISG